MLPIDLVQDPNFYVNLENGKPVLKKTIVLDILKKIQLAMELSGFDTCDFVVYTFKDYLRNKSIFCHKVVLDV